MEPVEQNNPNPVMQLPAAGAFRRYLAKMLDMFLVAALISLFFALLPRIFHVTSVVWYFLTIVGVSILFWGLTLFWESAWYLLLGNTPGKYFFGVLVTDEQGNAVSPYAFFVHAVYSWFFGSAMAIPAVRAISWIVHAFQVIMRGSAGYDRQLRMRVFAVQKHPWRIFPGVVLMLLALLCTVYFMLIPLFSDMKDHKLSRYELRESDFDELYWDDESIK